MKRCVLFALLAATQVQAGFFGATNFASGAMNDTNVGLSTQHQYAIAANVIGTNVTINGVEFSGTTNAVVGPNWSLAGAGNLFAANGYQTNVTGQLTNLMTGFQYNGAPARLYLSNLTAGAAYEVTLYNQSWYGGSRTQALTGSSGGSLVRNQDDGGGSLWRYVFAATGASEVVTMTPVIAANTYHFYGFSSRQVFNNLWNVIGDGTFHNDANWTRLDPGSPIGIPAAAGLSASFDNTQSGPVTVLIDSNTTLGHLSFAGANTYTLASTNGSSLTLEADAGAPASVVTPSGTHVLAVPLTLQSDLAKLGPGTLVLSNSVSGPGRLVAAGGILDLPFTNSVTGVLALSDGGRAQIDGLYPFAPGASLQFIGGLLRVSGTTVSSLSSQAVNWSNFNGVLDFVDAASAFTINSNIGTASAAGSFAKYGAGSLTFTNAWVNQQIMLFHQGSNYIESGSVVTALNYLSVGQLVQTGASMTVRGNGRLVSAGDFNIGDLTGSTGAVTVTDSAAVLGRTLYVGKSGNAVGTLDLAGGTFAAPVTGADWRFGGGGSTNDRNAYGYVRMAGGTMTYPGNFQVGGFGLGQIDLLAGGLTNSGGAAVIARYPGSRGTVVVAGGQWSASWGVLVGEQGHGVLSVQTGLVNLVAAPVAQGLVIGGWQTASEQGTGIVTLATGGTIVTPNVRKGAASSASIGMIHLDGGLLRATVANGTFMQGLDLATVGPAGANFDSQGINITIAQPLLAPTGDGVSSIALASGGSGYVGPPLVTLIGGGTGATAYAQIDRNAGVVTNLVVTSPGVNYTAAPTVLIQGGGGSGAAAGVIALTANTATGGLSKTGTGMLSLTGTNTYGGETVIQQGTILVSSTNALGTGLLSLATNVAGIGTTYAMDQAFLTWLTTRLAPGSSTGVLALGANSTNALDLTAYPDWSLGAANGAVAFSGSLLLGTTNMFLGGGNGVLTFVPALGTGTNVFIGQTGVTAASVVALTGTNDAYAGTIEVRNGTLRAGRANAFGGAAAVVNVGNGAVLDINGQNLGAVQVNITGSGIAGAGAIVNSGAQQINALQKVALTGPATFGGPNRWDIRGAGSVLDLAGYTLTKTNAVYIAAVGANVTDGSIVIGQGAFSIEAGTTVPAGAGQVSVLPAGTLSFYGSPSPTMLRPVTLNGGSVWMNGGSNVTVGSTFALTAATNLFTANPNATIAFTGVFSGAGALLKAAPGTMILDQTEAYTGATIVSHGTLEFASQDAAAGTISAGGGLTVLNGGAAMLDYPGALFGTNVRPVAVQTGGSLTTSNGVSGLLTSPLVLSGGSLDGGTPDPTLGSWRIGADITATSNATIAAPRMQLTKAGGVSLDVAAGSTLYAGGTFEDPAGSTGSLIKTGSGVLMIGATNNFTGPFVVSNGTVRFSQAAPTGLVARWMLEGNAADASGNGFNGTVAGAGSSYVSGRFGQGLRLTGAQRVDVPFNAAFRLTNYTVSAWFNLVTNPAVNGSYALFGTRVGGDTTLDFKIRNINNLQQFHGDIGNGTAWITTAADVYMPVSPGSWHLATLVVRTNGYAIYSDGMLLTNATYAATNTPLLMKAGQTMVLGDSNGSEKMNGSIDDVTIYGRVLTAAEIATLYTLGTPGLTNLLPAAAPLQLAAGTVFDLSGSEQTVGALADLNGGGGLVTNESPRSAVLTVGAGDASGSFSGVLSGGTNLSLVKIGAGTQTLNGASTLGGDFTVSNGSVIVNGSLSGVANTWLQGGLLGGTGTVAGTVLHVAGVVAPGSSAGILTLSGAYVGAGGSVEIELAGTTPGTGHDQLRIIGNASVTGTLNVATIGGFVPAAGQTFTVLTASAESGSFASVVTPALSDTNLGWEVQYLPDAVVLAVTGTPAVAATGYDLAALVITNGLTGYGDDADGDGFANLLEYVTGGSLTNPGIQAQMNGTRTNGLLALKFSRDTAATDATIFVEGSYTATNGADWIGIATNLAGSWGAATNVTEGGSSPVSVTVQDTETAATNRFLRLRVTR